MSKTSSGAGLGHQFGDHLGRLALTIVAWLLCHWLLLVVVAVGLYTALPVAAPFLMHTGRQRGAHLIYTVFRPLCHQLPERSFFLYGAQHTYTVETLAAHLGGELPLRYVGDATLGYKVAVCQRDIAIYGTMFLGAGLFALLRRWAKPLPNWALALFAGPMALDGGGQLLGFWSSSPYSRVITGALFGLGLIWWALPRLAEALAQTDLTA